jgi:protein tyrosine/serine phosphatase
MAATQIGWYDLEGACNVRDLGGLPAGASRTRSGVLVRADALDGLTDQDVDVLVAAGICHVVDLRSAKERGERGGTRLRAAGVTHSDLQAFDDEVLARRRRSRNEAHAAGVDPVTIMVDGYMELAELGGPTFVQVLERIVAPGGSPVVVHCSAGKDRTGVLVAVLLEVAGVERAAVVTDYAATQQRMADVASTLRASAAYQAMTEEIPAFVLQAQPETMEAFLARVDRRWGGAAGYLAAYGASDDALQTWRDLLLEPGPNRTASDPA